MGKPNPRNRLRVSRKITRWIQKHTEHQESAEYTQAKYLIEIAGWDLHYRPRDKASAGFLFAIAADSTKCVTRIKHCRISRSTTVALIRNGVAKIRAEYSVENMFVRIYCRKGRARNHSDLPTLQSAQ